MTNPSMKQSADTFSFRNRFFLLILFLAMVAAYYIFRPFLASAILALITAGMLRPLQLFYLRKFRQHATVATSSSLLTVILVVFVPLTTLMLLLVREGIGFVSYAQENLSQWIQNVLAFIQQINLKFPFLHLDKINLDSLLSKGLDQSLNFAMKILNSATQQSSEFAFQALVFLFCLYYFLIDWELFARWLEKLSPLASRHNRLFFDNFLSMGRAVLKSTLVLGAIQGTLGGIALAVVGVPSPIFWGVVMVFLSLLPVLGSALIWLPAGIIEIISGHPVAGIGLILFGIIVISNIDNLLRPRLVGNDTSLHPLAVFLSTMGGLVLFGLSGFILGPVAIALIASLLKIYQQELRPLWVGNEIDPEQS